MASSSMMTPSYFFSAHVAMHAPHLLSKESKFRRFSIEHTKKYSDEEKQASTLLRAAHGRHVAEAWQPGFN
jgi:hypothetical protein